MKQAGDSLVRNAGSKKTSLVKSVKHLGSICCFKKLPTCPTLENKCFYFSAPIIPQFLHFSLYVYVCVYLCVNFPPGTLLFSPTKAFLFFFLSFYAIQNSFIFYFKLPIIFNNSIFRITAKYTSLVQ